MTSVAFSGAFFAWPFHAGVASYLQSHGAPAGTARIYGTSSGGVVATMLACGIDLATDGLALGLRADRAGLAGRRTPFLRPRAFLAPHIEEMERALPVDAHERANGRLFLTLRTVPSLRQRTVSEFPTRDDLLDVLAATVAVPGLTVPLVHWSRRFGPCLDGGPGVPSDDRRGVATVRVGVFKGGHYDIRPQTPLNHGDLITLRDDAKRRALFEHGRHCAAAYFARTRAA